MLQSPPAGDLLVLLPSLWSVTTPRQVSTSTQRRRGSASRRPRMELGRAARPPRRCTASSLGCAGELLWTTPRQRPRPWLPAIPALARGSTESRSYSSKRSVSSCPQLEALLHTDENTYSHRVLFSASCDQHRADGNTRGRGWGWAPTPPPASRGRRGDLRPPDLLQGVFELRIE